MQAKHLIAFATAALAALPLAALAHPETAMGHQQVGLIDPYPIDNLTAMLGHDMEQVKDNLHVGATGLDLQLISRGHIDSHGADALSNASG